MITLSGRVSLLVDLPHHDLRAGDTGIVIEVLEGGKAFFVDFTTPEGETIDVVHVEAGQLRHVPEPRPMAAPER